LPKQIVSAIALRTWRYRMFGKGRINPQSEWARRAEMARMAAQSHYHPARAASIDAAVRELPTAA
jgi:hypothetical protein